jgi:5-methyltetrahydrofolate--homocysteine methyltransferase
VIHVIDASRSVNVVSSLLNPERKKGYLAEINAEYETLRAQYADRSSAREILSFDEAKANAFVSDWQIVDIPIPDRLGVTDFANFPLEELVDYFDWSPFFHAWELRGRFPAIFDDPVVGIEARKVYDDARRLQDEIVRHQRFNARGVFGFWAANRIGEEIQLYSDGSATRQRRFSMPSDSK